MCTMESGTRLDTVIPYKYNHFNVASDLFPVQTFRETEEAVGSNLSTLLLIESVITIITKMVIKWNYSKPIT